MAARIELGTRDKFRILWMIWFCLLGAIASYTLIVFQIAGRPDFAEAPPPARQVETLRYVLTGSSIAMFFLIRFVRNLMLSRLSPPGSPPPTDPSGSPSDERIPAPLFASLVVVEIVTYALCESIALFGFVLFMVGRNPNDYYVLLVLSVACFLIHRPSFDRFRESARRVSERRFA